jgi:phage-related minor tail protein
MAVADRTVRAIFEARVSGAQKGMRNLATDVEGAGKKVDSLTKDLKGLDKLKTAPEVQVKIDDATKRLGTLKSDLAALQREPASLKVDFQIEQAKAAIKDVRGEIRTLNATKAEVKISASVKDAQKRIDDLTLDLGTLRTMTVTPAVALDIKDTQRKLREAKAEIRDLNGAKAKMVVTADTSGAKEAIAEVGDAGKPAGDDAGMGIASGILNALKSIPIAGAVVGIGAAIALGLVVGIQQGLAIEAERDLFSARTGLDEATSGKFGRAAGEAYANAWGESIAANLDTARAALQFGLIDADAQDAEIEQVIASLSGLTQIMGTDIPETARTAGMMIRTGLAKNAGQAFDTLVSGYQNGANASEDLIDTFTEYPALFSKLGLSGDEAMGLIVQGMKAGARNSDLAADALKEFQIRATDGSKTSADGFKAVGLSAKDMTAQIAGGGEGAKKGLDQVLDGLRAMEDPVKRNAAGVALFGTQWEDMGDAMLALNVDTAVAALGSVAGSAGAAEKALTTMSDNTSTKIEEAKRNVEVAMDGIKGALAEAFGDEIGGAADWVSRNRAPLMQFFIDVINGALDAGIAFAEFSAGALDGIGALADGLASILNAMDYIPGIDLGDAVNSLNGLGDSARSGAETLRTEIPDALNETRDKVNTWAAPELLKARIHDATMAMTADMDAFSATVKKSGGEVKINGDMKNAEEALAEIVKNINGEDGTVTINGDKVPAEDALDTVIALIKKGKGNVTIGGDASAGRSSLSVFRSQVSGTGAYVRVNASTGAAERAITYTARDRTAVVTVNARPGSSWSVFHLGAHEGGLITKGLNAGGRVPGSDPGYDNVLWPLSTGGTTLTQPLAGGEYVVNSKDSAFWAPMLEWMNKGGRPTATAPASGSRGATRIEGVLDLGNGLTGVVRGVLLEEARSAMGGSSTVGVSL